MTPRKPAPPGDLVHAARTLMDRHGADVARWVLVDALAQALYLMEGDEPLAGWPVSTAAAGLDNREGSGGTSPGLHRIGRKIGRDAAVGTVFESREPTGRLWNPADPPGDDDLILTRILTLEGCEEGVNRGPGVDSRDRYIYIHGTNHEERLGEPVSHGCVRMANGAVVDLFARVEEGDPVVVL